MRISDWSSDVCSSDLQPAIDHDRGADDVIAGAAGEVDRGPRHILRDADPPGGNPARHLVAMIARGAVHLARERTRRDRGDVDRVTGKPRRHPLGELDQRRLRRLIAVRSEEHTSELQSLMRISYAVFCLKKTQTRQHKTNK